MLNIFVLAMDLAENDPVYFTPSLYEAGGSYSGPVMPWEELDYRSFPYPPASQCGTDWD